MVQDAGMPWSFLELDGAILVEIDAPEVGNADERASCCGDRSDVQPRGLPEPTHPKSATRPTFASQPSKPT
jgi:hypothetical protein